MFTWICPRCGREVPPSYTECPDCGRAEQALAAGTTAPAAPAGSMPVTAAPGQAASVQSQPSFLDLVQEPSSEPAAPQVETLQPAQPAFRSQPAQPIAQSPAPAASAPPSVSAPASFLGLGQGPSTQPAVLPAPRRGLPTWLLTLVFAAVFVGVVAGVYWLVDGGQSSSAKPAASVEIPAAQPGGPANPYQKYIEISGVRFLQNAKKKPEVKFVVTNHSGADISGLAGNVTVWGRTQKSGKEAAGSFQFSTNVAGWESKDLTAPLDTKLEMIELPDWQNVSTDVQVTAPAQ